MISYLSIDITSLGGWKAMSAIVIRNLSPETHRALQARATRHGRSTEAEARAILDEAVRPPTRLKLGSALAALVQPLGGIDLEIARDLTPVQPIDLE
jgi:antitoxin FitA